MEHELSLKEMQKQWQGDLRSYLIGFFSSLLLTIASFALVVMRPFSESFLIYWITGLALVQALFQLLFFLHLGEENKPRWESIIFWFMLLVLFIIVVGSLWIMYDLNERVMSHMTGEMAHD